MHRTSGVLDVLQGKESGRFNTATCNFVAKKLWQRSQDLSERLHPESLSFVTRNLDISHLTLCFSARTDLPSGATRDVGGVLWESRVDVLTMMDRATQGAWLKQLRAETAGGTPQRMQSVGAAVRVHSQQEQLTANSSSGDWRKSWWEAKRGTG